MKQNQSKKKRSEDFQTGRVVTIAAGHMVHDTYTGFLPAFLPIFIAQMMLSKTEAGLLSVFVQSPSIIQPFVGHGADRSTRHDFFFLLPAVSAVLMSMLGLVSNYGLLALLLIIVGINSAAFHAVVPVLVGRLSGRELGRGMSVWMVGGEFGRALGPLIIVTVIQFFSLKNVPWLMIPGVIVGLWLAYRMKDVHQFSPESKGALPWREALNRMRPVFFPVVGLIIVRGFMFASLTIYLPTFLTEGGSGLWTAGASLTILQIAGVVGAFLGGTLSDRMGRRRILLITMVISAAVMFLFLSTEGLFRIPLLIVMGITLISTTPVIMAVIQENFPQNRALANGAYMSLSFVLRSIIIVIVGVMGDLIGLTSAFLVSGVIMLIGLPFIFLLPEKKRGF